MAIAGCSRRGVVALVVAGLALAAPPRARAEGRHPLLPDQAKLQVAGQLGLVSAGGGWSLAGRRLELDLLVGWVPERWAGTDLLSGTAKLTWLPLSVPRGDWRIRPLTVALAVTHTRGDGFWIRQPSRYPAKYYPLPTGLRATAALGAAVVRTRGALSGFGAYAELVAQDLAIVHWTRNRRTTRVRDVVSLALGLRAEF